MFEEKPTKYIDFYNYRVVGGVAIFFSFIWTLGVGLVLLSVFNLSTYHPATGEEMVSYIAIAILSGVSHLAASIITLKSRDMFASVPPIIPTPIIGAVIFIFLLFVYTAVFGIG